MHVMKMDGSGMMTKEVGTLREIGAQVGDVYTHDEYSDDKYEITMIMNGKAYTNPGSYDDIDVGRCRIISRAKPHPKIWRDMTPEEKGALLLAAHEGKVIEFKWVGCSKWNKIIDKPNWFGDYAYRVKPDPKVETVNLTGADFGKGLSISWSMRQNGHIGRETHRITFQTIDGKPDCASIKMEEL